MPMPFVANVPAEVLTQVRRALALLPDIADLTRPRRTHPWAFVDSPEIDLPATQAAAAEVDAAVRGLAGFGDLSGVLRYARTPADLDALAHLLSGPAVGLDVLDETFTGLWTASTSAVLGEIAAFIAFRHPGLDVATPDALNLPLADIYVAAQTAAASSWFGRRRRLTAVRDRIAPYLRPGATVKPKDVPALVENLWRVQNSVQAIVARASSIPGLSVPEGWNPFADTGLLDRRVAWLRRAGTAVDGSTPFHVALRKLIVAGLPAGSDAGAAVARLRDAVSGLLAECKSDPDALSAWAGDDGFVLRWSMTRPERGVDSSVLMSLRRWVSFLDTLEPLRYAGLFDARRLLVTGAVPADDATRAFERGLAAASVAERLDATGLDMFDEGAHEKAIRRFTAASRAVREHLTTALPAKVLGTRPFDAASGNGQVGALQRELAKQRRGLGVRQLLSQYRRADHRRHAVRAGLAGLGGAVLPGGRRASSTWSCSTRRRRSGSRTRSARWAAPARPSSSATRSRCRRRRSPSRPPAATTAPTSRRRRSRTRSRSSASACRRGCRGSGCRGTTAARTSR